MNRYLLLLTVIIILAISGLACSEGADPVTADPQFQASASGNSHEVLWGYYDIYMDIENQTVEVVPNRNVMFSVNINTFLNMNPAALKFQFNGVTPGSGYVDVDLNVSITHPIPGQPKFNGYDVRGILIGDGVSTMGYNPDLVYAEYGDQQYMVNSDGYTRWFNKVEFGVTGIGGYTQGLFASAALNGTATLNPYKYFADNLTVNNMELFDWLVANAADNSVFSSGTTNLRNYNLRFAVPTPGIKYGYSIMANWGGGQPDDHPSNADEAVGCETAITESLYYVDGSDNGGDLILDVSLFGYGDPPSAIFIESTVLSSVYEFSVDDMVPVDQDDNWATYHVEIPADNITGVDGQEFWVIAEHGGHNYVSPFGVPNDAGTDTLAAIFRYDLPVSDVPFNGPPEVVSGVSGNDAPPENVAETYYVTANDPDMDTLTYNWIVSENGTGTEVYSGPGDGFGTILIHWTDDIGASSGELYDIDCEVSDGNFPPVMATTLIVTVGDPVNLPPIVLSGISGEMNPGASDIETYTVEAEDPEMDPLTYEWSIRDLQSGDEVYNDPGDGAGNIDIDWTNDIGASGGDMFLIFCSVSDSINDPVFANPLEINVS